MRIVSSVSPQPEPDIDGSAMVLSDAKVGAGVGLVAGAVVGTACGPLILFCAPIAAVALAAPRVRSWVVLWVLSDACLRNE